MTTDRDVDRLTAFLLEGPAELADRVFDAAFDEIHVTRQRRLPVPWRTPSMSSLTWRVAAIVAVFAIGGVALYATFLRGPTVGIGTPATALPTAPASITTPSSVPSSPAATPVAPTPSAAAGVLAPFGYAGGGTIAFTRDDSSVGGLAPFLVDPSGSNEARVSIPNGWAGATSVPGTGCCVAFSPDGTRFAVGYDEQNKTRGPGMLSAAQVLGLDGTAVSMVPVNCVGCGGIIGISYVPRAWSAKGGLVAVEARSDTDPTRNGINVAPVDVFDSGFWSAQVTGANGDTPLGFSPDGTRLLFVRHTTATGGELWVVTLDSKKTNRLSQAGEVVSADDYLAPGASWSADGKQVAYASTDASGSTANMRVSVVDAAGGPVTKITPATNFSTVAAWSPDGTWIAYDVDMGNGRHHVFVVHPDGSGARDLMPDASFGACCAHWSSDGTALVAPATTGADDQSLLVVLPLDGSGIRQVTSVPALYTSISWGAANR